MSDFLDTLALWGDDHPTGDELNALLDLFGVDKFSRSLTSMGVPA